MKGRGVGYKSLEGFIAVVRSIHRSAGIPEGICPSYGEKVKAIVKNCFDRYHPEGAPTLDLSMLRYPIIVAGNGCGPVTRMCKLGYSRLPYIATVSK